MSFGENPKKVSNIVDAQMERFSSVYSTLLRRIDGLAVIGKEGERLTVRFWSTTSLFRPADPVPRNFSKTCRHHTAA